LSIFDISGQNPNGFASMGALLLTITRVRGDFPAMTGDERAGQFQ
jgi:hypothetical protein